MIGPLKDFEQEAKEIRYIENHPFVVSCPHCRTGWESKYWNRYLYCPWCGARYVYLHIFKKAILIRKSEKND